MDFTINSDASGAATPGDVTFTDSDSSSLENRLRRHAFDLRETKAAIHGQQLPVNLGRLVTRHAVVRGIRYHSSFALGPAAVLRGVRPLFTRALNARAIMSNTIPEISTAEEFPYCIWHPDLPSRDTLRELVARYPQMRYQAGRTCAIAGYFDVYQTLDLLPEVAIAEEARESGNLDIFEHILKAPVKWRVFDDYSGTIHHSDPRPARLNGDTCIRNWLDLKQPVKAPLGLVDGEEGDQSDPRDEQTRLRTEPSGFPGFKQPPYEVTEDKQLDVKSSRPWSYFKLPDWDPESHFPDNRDWEGPKDPLPELPDIVKKLLYEPLPEDLPTCDKDWLIRMAAYTGNVDRYTRLRRPWFVEDELRCIERGIYHNVLFARWWATQITKTTSYIIRQAVDARYIMSDDLSRILRSDRLDPPFSQPYHIWHPNVARIETYWALAVHCPQMRHQVARAAIYADYQELFDLLIEGYSAEDGASALASKNLREVVHSHDVYIHSAPLHDVRPWRNAPDKSAALPRRVIDKPLIISVAADPIKPDHYLFLEAHFSPNLHYKTTLMKRAAELGLDITRPDPDDPPQQERLECVGEAHKLRRPFSPEDISMVFSAGNFTCDAKALESYVLMPDEWRPSLEEVSSLDNDSYYLLCYANWPRSVWAVASSL